MPRQTSLASIIQSTTSPWVVLLVLEAGTRPERILHVPEGFGLHVLRGTACRTAAALFKEFAHALKFPDYFGHNWDALEECLVDLEWLPAKGYLLVVTESERVLTGGEEDYNTFLEVLSDAGEAWASGQGSSGMRRPFHVILTVSKPQRFTRAHWGVPEVGLGAERRRRPSSGS